MTLETELQRTSASVLRNNGTGWLTARRSYLTTEEGPVQQSASNGLIVADRFVAGVQLYGVGAYANWLWAYILTDQVDIFRARLKETRGTKRTTTCIDLQTGIAPRRLGFSAIVTKIPPWSVYCPQQKGHDMFVYKYIVSIVLRLLVFILYFIPSLVCYCVLRNYCKHPQNTISYSF